MGHLIFSTRAIDNGVLAVADAKRRYHNRFPWSPYEYLTIVVDKADALMRSEWVTIRKKWSAIESQIGGWPYDLKLRLKLLIAPHTGLRPLLKAVDAVWCCKCKCGDVLRFLHLRKRLMIAGRDE